MMSSRLSATSPAAAVSSSPAANTVESDEAFRSAYSICIGKSATNMARLADRPMSGAFAADGNYFNFHEGFFDIGNWTSSFFTGMALLGFESSKDLALLREVNRLAVVYRDKVFVRNMDTMHDLGFLYTLYSVGLFKLTGDLNHRCTGLKAADELAKRFVPRGRYIRAWGRMDDAATEYAGLAIIDCMMNLPLLFWASEETGNDFYADIARMHADTTLANFLREDDSVYHAFRFDRATGAPARGENYCGHGVETQWARGTTWAIYGFALAYRYTKDTRYLEASRRVARKLLSLLDDTLVPVWDFRLSEGMPPLLDTSAGAIAVCGFQELLEHDPEDRALADAALSLLGVLCADYVNPDPACPGILKGAQVGDGLLPGQRLYRARSVYTSWGDYYLMEALARHLYGMKSYW